jgi:hypothetical protein
MSRQIASVKYFLKNLQKNPQISQIAQIIRFTVKQDFERIARENNLSPAHFFGDLDPARF